MWSDRDRSAQSVRTRRICLIYDQVWVPGSRLLRPPGPRMAGGAGISPAPRAYSWWASSSGGGANGANAWAVSGVLGGQWDTRRRKCAGSETNFARSVDLPLRMSGAVCGPSKGGPRRPTTTNDDCSANGQRCIDVGRPRSLQADVTSCATSARSGRSTAARSRRSSFGRTCRCCRGRSARFPADSVGGADGHGPSAPSRFGGSSWRSVWSGNGLCAGVVVAQGMNHALQDPERA